MRLVWMMVGIAMLAACSDETCGDWPGVDPDTCRPPAANFDAGAVSPEDAVDAGGSVLDAAEATPDAQKLDAGTTLVDANPAIPCFADSPANASGVSIHIEGDNCHIPFGHGATFRYRVALDRALPYQVAAGSSCGFCSKLGSDVKPLIRATVFASGNVSAFSYCADCDVGCCPPNQKASYELAAQSYEGVLDWPGRTFNGPSDTSQKPGDFFARGAALVLITVTLPDTPDPIATAKLPITIE